MSDKAEDKETGISIRFIRQYDIEKDLAPSRRDWFVTSAAARLFAREMIDMAEAKGELHELAVRITGFVNDGPDSFAAIIAELVAERLRASAAPQEHRDE